MSSPFNETRYKELLEGLEINILSKYEAFNPFFKARLDPEFYQKSYLSLFESIIQKKNKFISELAYVTDGEHGNTATYSEGYSKYYGARNVLKGILNDNNVEFITKEHHQKLKKTALKPRDLLISCVGANIGFASIVPDNIGIGNIVRNVALIRGNKEVNNEYLLAYFLSNYGRNLYIRMNTGNAQPLVSLDYIKTVPVFIPSLDFQNFIKKLISQSLISNSDSKKIYTQAEIFLLKTIGLKDFQPSTDPINVKGFKESFLSTGRLDAEYYQRKYEEIEEQIIKFDLGFTTVQNEFLLSKDVMDRSLDFYNYTEISDINVSDGSISYNKLAFDELPDNGKMVLKKDQIIISKVRPYRGAIGIVRECPENYVGSGAFTILSEKSDYKKEVLQTILRSKPYQELIMKFNVGSSYPVVKDDDILNLPIPKIDAINQIKIAELVEESYHLKKQSEHLLETAKRAVEIAIEEGEEVGMEYLNNN